MRSFLQGCALLVFLSGCVAPVRTLELHVNSPALLPMRRISNPDAMEIRTYRLNGSRPFIRHRDAPQTSKVDLKEIFAAKGVEFPDGSTLVLTAFKNGLDLIETKNTQENLEKFENELIALGVWSMQVEIGVRLLDVSSQRAVTALKERPISLPKLSKLLGHGIRIVDSTQTTTINAVAMGVKSYFQWPPVVGATPSVHGYTTNSPSGTVCQSRLEATPTVGSDGYTVNIALVWQASLVGTRTNDNSNKPASVLEIGTSVVIYDGQSLAFELPNQSTLEVHDLWLLLTVRLVDPSGTPVH